MVQDCKQIEVDNIHIWAGSDHVVGSVASTGHQYVALVMGIARFQRKNWQYDLWARSIQLRQAQGQASRAAKPGMADLPAQSRPRYRRYGLVRCSHYRF